MNKKILLPLLAVITIGAFFLKKGSDSEESFIITPEGKLKQKNKPENARHLFSIERQKHELNMQRNPLTGEIPLEEKSKEFDTSLKLMKQKRLRKTTSSTYISRGPSNLGGRTRAFAVDISDATSNTILSGGVSSGLFRTTDAGANWTKVSPQGNIHNVTALAQDPRTGFQNIWYYATGELSGNSASLKTAYYRGQGVWKSTDNGLTWTVIPGTDSNHTVFDSYFDYTNALEVSPTTGELFIATTGRIYRYDGANLNLELQLLGSNSTGVTDVVVTNSGKVYAAYDGSTDLGGVWSSPNGTGSWTKIAKKNIPVGWDATGRIVLAEAPSNDDIIYALFIGSNSSSSIAAGLWQYNASTGVWIDYSSKLPDEPGGDSDGNDPFTGQGGYDLVVSVKPDNENFVTIGGTNAYKIVDITNDATFKRIGGYANNSGYGLYNNHHPDIHVLEFDPNNNNILYSGTDGGIHKTADINATSTMWQSLNNNYVTYQYYHVALDPLMGSNFVMGGAQDNGTTIGGTDAGQVNNTTMSSEAGGDGVAVGIARRNANVDTQLYLGFQQGTIYTKDTNGGYREITPKDAPSGRAAKFVTYFYLDPDNNDLLYYAANGELYRTDDAASVTSETWVNAGRLISFENFSTFATTRGTYNPATSFLLIGGESGGIFKIDDPKNTSNIITSKRITPTGATTTDGTIVSDIAIHPTNPDIVLATYANYGIDNIFLTTNATAATPTWTMVERNLSAHSIRSAAITQVGSEIIYFIGTARGLYSSTDPTTKDWEMEGANSIGLSLISGLVYRPSDNKLLIGTHGNGMFETTVEGTLSTNDYTNNTLEVSFYPNPTEKELRIESSSLDLSKNVKFKISDINGKTVKMGDFKNQRINVENLQSGVYLMNLDVNGKKQNFKFIKQ